MKKYYVKYRISNCTFGDFISLENDNTISIPIIKLLIANMILEDNKDGMLVKIIKELIIENLHIVSLEISEDNK